MPVDKKRKQSSTADVEGELEEFLFGKTDLKSSAKSVVAVDESVGEYDSLVEFAIDRAADVGKSAKKVVEEEAKAAWHDDDDDEVEIDLNSKDRLKKLNTSNNNIVSATQLTSMLQERFATKKLKWAARPSKKSDQDGLDLLQQTDSFVNKGKHGGDQSSHLPLPKGKMTLKRMVNANVAEPSKKEINALSFHSSGDLLMTAGQDKYMRFFKIDGEKNDKQLSVKFDMAISQATFLGSSQEVLAAGRKPYLYSYDTKSGGVTKIPGPIGRQVQSLEKMTVSSDGTKAAFIGTGGYIHLMNGRSKQWMGDLKSNTSVRSVTFIDEHTLASSGLDADVYIWDLRNSAKCVERFAHEDGSCSSFLAAYSPPSSTSSAPVKSRYHLNEPTSKYLAVGTESGVVSVFGASRTNPNNDTLRFGQSPQLRTIMNLTTQITCCAFHPTGQVLAIASDQKKDQLKLVHMPSLSVFTNWPTENTPFNRVKSLAFSPMGGYLAVGNAAGRVLLYRLNHFSQA